MDSRLIFQFIASFAQYALHLYPEPFTEISPTKINRTYLQVKALDLDIH